MPHSDSNLRTHLARRHQLMEVLYPSQRLNYQPKTQLLSSDFKKQLDDALIYSIIKDSRPFGDFRKVGFQRFLQLVLPGTNYKGPHRLTIRKRLTVLYRSHRSKLIEELSMIKHISLTVDAWTSPRRAHFICITAHYFDKDFELVSRIIAFRRFIGRTFAMRLRRFISNELRKLKISDKIRSITTDNGVSKPFLDILGHIICFLTSIVFSKHRFSALFYEKFFSIWIYVYSTNTILFKIAYQKLPVIFV